MGFSEYIKSKFKKTGKVKDFEPDAGSAPDFTILKPDLVENMTYLQGKFDGCADFVVRELTVCGKKGVMITIDNMIDKVVLSQSVITPLTSAQAPSNVGNGGEALFDFLRDDVLSLSDQHEVFSYEELIAVLMAGFAVFILDGVGKALAFGVQGFKFRSIDEPNTDSALRGSREGFVEPLRINLMLVRRRLKNPNLKFEIYTLGSESKTEVCLCYIKGMVSDSILSDVRHRLRSIDMETVLESGYIQRYFQDETFSIFSTVGATERPDTLCGRLNEGRVGIIVDNTPYVLTMPHLFIENFQNMDDYAVGPYYATFTRVLKYVAFFISVLVPGLYVAIGSFHQALLPSQLLYMLAQSEEATPFPLVLEAILMQVIYEMVREAGVRLPKQIGFAVSLVGALLIGQAAVSANIIGAPMVIIVALTATTSLIIPTLYEPGVIMRFAFIILAGMAGLYGITLGIAFLAIHLCSLKSYEVPFTAPLSPFNAFSMRDVILRAPWKQLSKRKIKAEDLPGSNVDKTQG